PSPNRQGQGGRRAGRKRLQRGSNSAGPSPSFGRSKRISLRGSGSLSGGSTRRACRTVRPHCAVGVGLKKLDSIWGNYTVRTIVIVSMMVGLSLAGTASAQRKADTELPPDINPVSLTRLPPLTREDLD